jgi:hypothetical protein
MLVMSKFEFFCHAEFISASHLIEILNQVQDDIRFNYFFLLFIFSNTVTNCCKFQDNA